MKKKDKVINHKFVTGKVIGVGGFKCSCCMPYIGKKAKRWLNRLVRRKVKQNLNNGE